MSDGVVPEQITPEALQQEAFARFIGLGPQLAEFAQLGAEIARTLADVKEGLGIAATAAAVENSGTPEDVIPEAPQDAAPEIPEEVAPLPRRVLYSAEREEQQKTVGELKRIAELDAELPYAIQDVFSEYTLMFEDELATRRTPEDPWIKDGIRRRPKPPKEMPKYDAQNPKAWDEFVAANGQYVRWTEEGGEFSCMFTTRYVRLENGDVELVGYSFNRQQKGGHALNATLLGGHENPSYAEASVQLSDGDVVTATFTATVVEKKPNPNDGRIVQPTIRYAFLPNLTRVLAIPYYSAVLYAYDSTTYSLKAHPDYRALEIGGTDLLYELADYMNCIPTLEE